MRRARRSSAESDESGSIRYVDVDDPGILDDVDDPAAYSRLLETR